MLSSWTAANVADLIADINAANRAGGSNTILLAPNTTFDLTAVNNTTNGPNGLPVIAARNNLSIVGQGGDIIQRHPSQVYFRLFDVAGGGALGLSQVTLQNGEIRASTTYAGAGGAIYSQGTLVLDGVTVQNNVVWGLDATAIAAGGGIWSSGTLTLRNGTLIKGNEAWGGGVGVAAFGGGIWSSGILTLESGTRVEGNNAHGGAGDTHAPGGEARGGGLYIAGGAAALTGATVDSNSAVGGDGGYRVSTKTDPPTYYPWGHGGDAYGGGLFVAAGSSITLREDSVYSNTASGGMGHDYGTGYGGGVFIGQKAKVYLDAFTLAHIAGNMDDSGWNSSTANIDGSYTLIT